MGKWRRMERDINTDAIACPNCGGVFVLRRRRGCPFCRVRIVYPGDWYNPEAENQVLWNEKIGTV